MQNGGPQEGHRHYVLYACIPILDEAPRGWTLALVDTPVYVISSGNSDGVEFEGDPTHNLDSESFSDEVINDSYGEAI